MPSVSQIFDERERAICSAKCDGKCRRDRETQQKPVPPAIRRHRVWLATRGSSVGIIKRRMNCRMGAGGASLLPWFIESCTLKSFLLTASPPSTDYRYLPMPAMPRVESRCDSKRPRNTASWMAGLADNLFLSASNNTHILMVREALGHSPIRTS